MTIDAATREILRLTAEVMEKNSQALFAIANNGVMTEWYSVNDYAAKTGTSRSTVLRRIAAGELPNARKRGGQWLIEVQPEDGVA